MSQISRHTLILILTAIFSLGGILPGSASSRSVINAQLDSATLLMGKTTKLHVKIARDKNLAGQLVLPNVGDTIADKVEIAEIGKATVTDIGNNREQITQEITLQAFDPGEYTIGPLTYLQGNDTIYSEPLPLVVTEVNVDSLETVNDYLGPESTEAHFWDFLPLWVVENIWVIIIVLTAVVGLIVALILLIKRRRIEGPKMRPEAKPVPPYEAAMMALKALDAEKLCEKGLEKIFYTRLTDILRIYLHNRFGINAMEMSTSEILETLKKNEATRLPESYMRQVLEVADYVKFAKLRPMPSDNIVAFNSALQFVENTRPVPEAQLPINDKQQ